MLYHLLFLLLVKHFICDFALQGRLRQTHDKHKLTSLKGHLHALDHAVGTSLVFVLLVLAMALNSHFISLWVIPLFGIMDYVIHLIIDWLKNNFVKANDWQQSSREFWILTSIDQCLHALTYLVIVILFDIYFF